jgi:hypothetical protein
MRQHWTKADVLAERPAIPVDVTDFPLVTTGLAVPDGNNPWVVAHTPRGTAEARFSWGAVLEALNTPGVRLPLDVERRERLPATPAIV